MIVLGKDGGTNNPCLMRMALSIPKPFHGGSYDSRGGVGAGGISSREAAGWRTTGKTGSRCEYSIARAHTERVAVQAAIRWEPDINHWEVSVSLLCERKMCPDTATVSPLDHLLASHEPPRVVG